MSGFSRTVGARLQPDRRSPSETKIAAVWRPLLALGLGVALALAADQAIRLTLEPPAASERHWYLNTVQYHPVLGWSGYPNFVGMRDGRPVQTNSLGYRDREPADGANGRRPRVLFLGDSFTWGDEVGLDERYTSLLEASCGDVCDHLPAIRAINHGIIGYGTAQEFLNYLLSGRQRPHDVVILAVYTGNDLNDNAEVESPSGPRPRLIRCDRPEADEGLCLEGVPVPPVVDWPEHRLISPRGAVARRFGWSGLVSMASERRAPGFLLDRRIAAQQGDALPFPIVPRTSDANIADRIGQFEAIITAFNRAVRADGKTFGVLLFPSARVYAGDPERELRDYGAIAEMLNRLGIPFADFHGRTKDRPLDDLYFGIQGHWRPSGHQEAANVLRALLVTLQRSNSSGG